MNKIVYIARGIPGSGKSFQIRKLVPKENIFSADDFWGENYDFDFTKLGKAHQWNQSRAMDAMEHNITPIAIDNTNLTWKSIKPYAEMAKKHDYKIKYVEPTSYWWVEFSKFKAENKELTQEQIDKFANEFFKRNTHNVPLDTVKRMIEQWTPTEKILERS